jgi:putative flippase GtrA
MRNVCGDAKISAGAGIVAAQSWDEAHPKDRVASCGEELKSDSVHMNGSNQASSLIRWLKFNLVGAIGIAVQLGVLALLTAMGFNYLLATAAAVESAVLHNFVWHERYTWRDRGSRTFPSSASRLARFNLSTGAISIGGNLLLMRLLVGQAHLPPFLANLLSIAGCSLVNFLVSDRWVFRGPLWPVPGREAPQQ